MNWCPSNRSPRKATKSSCGVEFRVSVPTLVTIVSSGPQTTPPVATAIWRSDLGSMTLHLHRVFFQRPCRYLNIIARNSAVGELLIFFVSFASDQNDVPRLRELNCAGNCLPPLKSPLESLTSRSGLDLPFDLHPIHFSAVF